MIHLELTGLEAAGLCSVLVTASQSAKARGDDTMHNLYVRVARKIKDANDASRKHITDVEIPASD